LHTVLGDTALVNGTQGVDMCTSAGGGHGTSIHRRRRKHVQFDADEWRELESSVCEVRARRVGHAVTLTLPSSLFPELLLLLLML